ncbi:MAG: type I-E CRISPR-associated protein Cas6/Cse3/CasE [Endomicrobiales bacterium]|nr:type I-E CRISPR-associated protein Cas6/Cse3/CasE [Endomicrobiales bacterium]
MIASVLKLNRTDCKALKLEDAYSIHRIVYSLFPKLNEQTRDFLFADKGGDFNSRQILILSARAPVVSEFGELTSKEIPKSFLAWEHYGFEVTVNPTQRNGPSKTTMPIKGEENLRVWFLQKAGTWGFDVESNSLQVCRVGVVRFDKTKDKKQFSHTHSTATFIGRLKVIDRKLFKNSFESGLGRAKGFGFGLLQIVPLTK